MTPETGWWRQGLETALAIDGWMREGELLALMRLARDTPAGANIVEIGTYRGRSSVALAFGARHGAGNRVYSFDPHLKATGFRGGSFGPADQAYLYRALADAGVGETVCVVCLDSKLAAAGWADDDVGLLLIDGDHREEAVRGDLFAWLPRLRQDAVLAFDDADLEDVDRVIRDACRSRLLEPLGREGKLAWFQSGTSRDT